MFCFSAFGENVRFHSGFSFRIWAPVLWCFVFQHLALVTFEPFGRLWRPLGLPLGPPGIEFLRFFGSRLGRPKWPLRFCSNTMKQMVLGLFFRRGWLAEIDTSEPLCSQTHVLYLFLRVSANAFWSQIALIVRILMFHLGFAASFSGLFGRRLWPSGWLAPAGWPADRLHGRPAGCWWEHSG